VNTNWSRYIVNPGPKKAVRGLEAAVTTDSAIVTEVMVDVLRNGGNAADAGIAGCLVQAAVEPFMTNHAGLITFLYYEAKTGIVHQLDAQGAHPSGLPPFRPVPQGHGPYTAAGSPSAIIPGFMPGLKAIHEKFGTAKWSTLCEPAVEWAQRGHPVSTFEYSIRHSDEQFTTYFPEGRDFFTPNGYLPAVGEIAVPKGLARTLEGVRDEGPDYMIRGPWAKAFVSKANEMGWNIRLEHMTETPPRWIEPIRIRHHEYEIVTLGPPQAQGFIIGVALGVLRHLGIREMQPGSAEHFWAMGHALRQAARHWEYAQDETIYGVPRDEVLDDAYHAHLARMIQKSRPKIDLTEHIRLSGDDPSSSGLALYGGAPPAGRPRRAPLDPQQPVGSCELAVVDAEGNWVQMMNTLQGSGIPGQVIGGVPMVGSHATFGHLHSAFDSTLVKGAKLRCVIGNTLVLEQGKPVLSAGTPGTPQLTLPQVLTYALDFKFDPYAAVDAPRQYAMAESRGLVIEDRLRPGVVEDLHKLGVRVGVVSAYDYHLGSFSVIARDEATGTLTAVADPRRCAVADGIRPETE
jgi:gamma-glutamyltranspeptidase / glutathione hydrolase